MADIRLLERTLAATVPLNRARRNFLAKFVVALIRVKTVNLAEVASAFAGRALPESSYKRIQRFLRLFELPYAAVALALLRQSGVPPPFVVTLDRTEWQLGSTWLNVMVVGVAHEGVALPVIWRVLPKKGCASTVEKVEIVARFVRLCGAGSVEFLAADREFADRGLFRYLRAAGIDFRIRVKRNALVRNGRGEVVQAWRLFRSQRTGVGLALPGLRRCWGMALHFSGLRLASGEYVIVAAPRFTGGALSDYGRRWEIETMFGCLKSRGFRLEETHVTDPARLEKLMALLALTFCWAVVVGAWLRRHKPLAVKKHGRRCKSLFRHGLDYLRRILCDLESRAKRTEFRRVILLLSRT
jgi:Transposase DDE domain